MCQQVPILLAAWMQFITGEEPQSLPLANTGRAAYVVPERVIGSLTVSISLYSFQA